MGTWSEGPFGNDAAADWTWGLDDADSWAPVAALIRSYLSSPKPDEGDDVLVVAAAATVAYGIGSYRQDDSDTESVEAFVSRMGLPPQDLVVSARQALQHASAPDSELALSWAEAGGETAWRVELDRLDKALSNPS